MKKVWTVWAGAKVLKRKVWSPILEFARKEDAEKAVEFMSQQDLDGEYHIEEDKVLENFNEFLDLWLRAEADIEAEMKAIEEEEHRV